jgi:hypothetical protein
MSVIVEGSPAVIEADPTAPPRHVLVLSLALGVVGAIAAALTFYLPDVLTGPAVTNGNARGTALVMLYGAVPVLLVSTFLASRGSWRAVLFWFGSMFYLAYNAFLLLFLTPINQLFLGYIATQSLAVFAIFTLYSALDDDWLVAQMRPPPRRTLAVLVWTIVALNVMAWLGAIVPALMSDDPSTLVAGTGVATNAIYVQDLVFWLPMMALAAWWLWHGRASGILLTGSWLLFGVIESVGIAVDQWFGHQADPTSTWASVEIIPFLIGLAVVNAAGALFYMRARKEPTG